MKTLLFLQWRNFGDAVIGLALIESLWAGQPHLQIDVMSRPQFAFLYENHPAVRKVYTSSFPIGTMMRFTLRDAFHLVAELLRARNRHYDAVANLFGDIRENTVGRFISPKGNYSIVWPPDHTVSSQAHVGPTWLLSHPVYLPRHIQSAYTAIGLLAAALGGATPAAPRIYGADKQPMLHTPRPGRIGLHVSAGLPCKRWPMDRWAALASVLLADGKDIRIYCAPAERDEVQAAFQSMLIPNASIEVVSGSIEQFLNDVATCSLMIAHDSFGIHAAAAIGVPRIMVNGPNIPEVWAPSGTTIMRGDETLPCFPCFGRPTCTPGPGQYACIRSIPVEALHRLVQISL
jgi:ADP-heptose:LPS heptosyltransferase